MNQAEIDALRREHTGGPSPMMSPVHDLRSTVTPPGTPSLPPLALALDTGDKRPTSPFMAPLNLDGVGGGGVGGGISGLDLAGGGDGGDEKTPPSAATARTDGSVDEPCTYEVEGIGGRIPRGVSVDLSQMGMEEWDDPAAAAAAGSSPTPADVVRERASLDNPSGMRRLNGEPVDTWNLVLDNPPSGMMAALDECVDGVDAVNEMGYTCVMWAALYGKEEHLIVLLECEADVSMQLQEDYYSKTYPAGSTALDIATITQEKTGSDRKLIIQMLTAARDAKWDDWKASEKGAKVWRKWQEKWEKDKQKREREEATKRDREKKRKSLERRAVARVRENPFAASTQTVSTWLNSLGHDLGQYANVFDTQAVDGATLMSLTEAHLKEELKVRTLGQRLRILRARDEALGIATRVPFATKEEVGLWMNQIGLSMYAYAFESNEIDGLALCALTEEQLRDDLHVRTLGHRLKVQNMRETFREQCEGAISGGQGGGMDDEEALLKATELRRRAQRGGGAPGAADSAARGRSGSATGDSSGLRRASTAPATSAPDTPSRSHRRNGGKTGATSKGKSSKSKAESGDQPRTPSKGGRGGMLPLGMVPSGFRSGFLAGCLVSVAFTVALTQALNSWMAQPTDTAAA